MSEYTQACGTAPEFRLSLCPRRRERFQRCQLCFSECERASPLLLNMPQGDLRRYILLRARHSDTRVLCELPQLLGDHRQRNQPCAIQRAARVKANEQLVNLLHHLRRPAANDFY